MLTLMASAKVNLFLHVGDVRDDGYHDLSSLAVFPEIGDEVQVVAGSGLSLDVTGPFADDLKNVSATDNLIHKAALLLARHLNLQCNAHIGLAKHLPPASGIGGGTADAVAALVLLRDLWMTDINDADLMALAFELGADGPLCLSSLLHPFDMPGFSALMTGAGEVVEKGPKMPPLHMVLINPGVSVSTGAIFKRLDKEVTNASVKYPVLPTSFSKETLIGILNKTRNDLMAPALAEAPIIGTVLEELITNPACLFARMSGSGATCFGLFENVDAAEQATRAAAQKGWWAANGGI